MSSKNDNIQKRIDQGISGLNLLKQIVEWFGDVFGDDDDEENSDDDDE